VRLRLGACGLWLEPRRSLWLVACGLRLGAACGLRLTTRGCIFATQPQVACNLWLCVSGEGKRTKT